MPAIESSEVFEQDPNLNVTELDDGSAIVDIPEEATAEVSDFYANLAETLDRFTLNKTASDLLDLIEKDQEARKQRDKLYEEGLKRTGLGDDAPGGALFDGASRVVHPVLAEGCVDFAARAIKELFPVNGPVKIKIRGESNSPKLDLAKRKRDYLNWYLTNKLQEYRAEKEVLLTQLPLGGSQYEKYWYSVGDRRIRMEFVPVDKVLLPFSANSFYTSPRVTHIQDITQDEFEARVKSGFYKDLTIVGEASPEETASQTANNKIEGKESNTDNPDGLRIVYECSCTLALEDEETQSPYVIHIDEPTGKIVAAYRNWAEEDANQQKLDWWTEHKFIPWRGALGIGLPHLIGGLAGSLTGALRALLDSAHINNSPGAVKLKGGRTSGANIQINQTEVKEIDAPAGVDDIRKVMMPLPFNPPSAVLFQLLDWLTGQAKGVITTAEEKIADASNQMPVGTALALIEQGSQVFSSIHSRLHDAQRRSLHIICRLISQYPDEGSLAKYNLTAADFADVEDIEPVSDPNIFSEAQRFAQLQEQIKVTTVFPQLNWNHKELARRALEQLRTDGIDSILPKDPDPVTADPVSENVEAAKGKPLKASIEQDHRAHVQAHLTYILNPMHQALQGPDPSLGMIMGHIKEHLLMAYEVGCQMALPTATAQLAAQDEPLNPDKIAMAASNIAAQQIGQEMQQLTPLLQQAGQIVAAKMPQPPVDPAVQKTFEAAMAEIERKKKADADRLTLDQQQSANAAAAEQAAQESKAQLEMMREDNKSALAMIQEENKRQQEENRKQQAVVSELMKKEIEELRAKVALAKNEQDNQQHQMTELLKNHGDNQTQVIIAQLKEELGKANSAQPTQNDAMLKEMQRMLGEIEKAKTGDALTTMVDALRTMMAGMQDHQARTMAVAERLINS